MNRGYKKRKKSDNFRGLIDVDLPLWKDLFSVVFNYLTNRQLNSVLRTCKKLFEVVRERAVFRGLVIHNSNVPQTLKKFGVFFFFFIDFMGDCTLKGEVERRNIERQRYLEIVRVSYVPKIDMRVFCGMDGNTGRWNNPRIRSVYFKSKDLVLSGTHLYEFMRAIFPRRLNFGSLNTRFTPQDIAIFREFGKFNKFVSYTPHNFCVIPGGATNDEDKNDGSGGSSTSGGDKDLSGVDILKLKFYYLIPLDLNVLTSKFKNNGFLTEIDFSHFFAHIQLSHIVDFLTLEFVKPENFRNVTSLSFTYIDFYRAGDVFTRIVQCLVEKRRVEKIKFIGHYAVQEMCGIMPWNDVQNTWKDLRGWCAGRGWGWGEVVRKKKKKKGNTRFCCNVRCGCGGKRIEKLLYSTRIVLTRDRKNQ